MRTRLATVAWLAAMWTALWGTPTAGTVLTGLLVGGALVLAFPIPAGDPGATRVRPLAAVRFLGYLARKVVEGNLVVAREVVSPGAKRVNEGIVAVPVTGASTLVLSVLAGSLSLAPGTLVLEVGRAPTVLYVHVFHLHSVEEVRLDVYRMERLLVRAIGSRECLRDVEERIARLTAAADRGEAR